MATWLRVSTAVDIKVGPFLDQTDGSTVESALTITQPDIRLAKNGGAWAQKSAAQTLTHEENGWYEVSLSTTDTDTLGILIVAIHESGALPVWREFNVVPANIYDSLFSTDLLQVDLTQWLGSTPGTITSGRVRAQTEIFSAGAIDSGSIATDAFTAAKFATDAVAKIRSVASGTSDSGTTTTMVDAARTEADTDYWKGNFIVFTSGTINGQCGLITGFNPATDTITFVPATTQAVSTQTYEILPAARVDIHSWLGSVVNSLVSGRVDSSVGAVAANAITDASVSTDMDSYAAKVWIIREGTTADHYGVGFFKNGQPVTGGITSPTIQVIKGSDGTDLIASTALTEIGSLGIYKKDEATNKMTTGALYFAKVTATIDGSSRTYLQQIGRDST